MMCHEMSLNCHISAIYLFQIITIPKVRLVNADRSQIEAGIFFSFHLVISSVRPSLQWQQESVDILYTISFRSTDSYGNGVRTFRRFSPLNVASVASRGKFFGKNALFYYFQLLFTDSAANAYQCNICHSTYSHPGNFKQHLLKHERETAKGR